MGGYGSGRWGTSKPGRKLIVESCRTLDVNRLVQQGVIRPNADRRGAWEWRNDPDDETPSASVGFDVRTGTDSGVLRLRYTVTFLRVGKNGSAAELMNFPIRLVTTRLPSKGLRWWFICDAEREDRVTPCHQRVGKLYLPSGGTIFACRHCYDLTYRSCRESRTGQAMWNTLGASVGMSGKRAKKILDESWNGDKRFHDRLRQRAVSSIARRILTFHRHRWIP